MSIPDTWQAGATSFITVTHGSNSFAVVKGKTIEDLKYVFKVKPFEGKFFFVNMDSKAKTWELPDCYPNDRSLSADQLAKTNSNNATPAAQPQQRSPSAAPENPQQQPQRPTSPAAITNVIDAADRGVYVDRVRAIYLKYNPSKLSDLDNIVGRFEGRFDALIQSLVQRYGAEPDESERQHLIANAVSAGGAPDVASPLTAADAAASPGPPHNASSSFSNREPLNENTTAQDRNSLTSPTSGFGSPKSVTSVDGSPTSPEWTYRDRVYNIYNKYAPDKAKHAEKQLRTYVTQEEVLIKALVNKYGPEPPRPVLLSNQGSPISTNTSNTNDRNPQQNEYPQFQRQSTAAPTSGNANDDDDDQLASPASQNKNRQLQSGNDDNQQQDNNNAASYSNQQQFSSPSRRDMVTHATETEPSPLPYPRAPIVTVDLPAAAPQTPSPIFDTQKLLQAPASVRQELLMSFLQDRDARLKEALDRNERYSQVIQQLQDGHDNLSRECEQIKRRSIQEQESLRSQLRDVQHSQEMTKSKWAEERDRSASQQELDKLEAQRKIHSQLIALEETKIQYGKEISDLKSKLSVSSHASKAVREEATALLSVLARKEEQLRSQQEELNKLQIKLQGPAKISAGVQTQESLSDIIRSVAKHMSGGGPTSPRSASAEAESFKNISARLAQANHDRSAPLPIAEPHSCKRCQRAPGVLACRICRLTLCYHCDETVHASNIRFRAHNRILVAIDGREGAANRSGSNNNNNSASRSLSQQQNYNNNNSPDRVHMDATLGLMPSDIDEQLASGMDAEVFDRVIAQFDVAYAAKRDSKNDEVERLRQYVRELEDNIAKAKKENQLQQQNNLNNNNNSNVSGVMGALSPIPRGTTATTGARPDNYHQLANVHLQIENEQRRNAELTSRIQELEAMLLASPENKEFEQTGGSGHGVFSADEKKQLEMHINQLQRDLDNSRNEVKERRREIAEMRSLLAAHMSSPANSRKKGAVQVGGTPQNEKAKPMHF